MEENPKAPIEQKKEEKQPEIIIVNEEGKEEGFLKVEDKLVQKEESQEKNTKETEEKKSIPKVEIVDLKEKEQVAPPMSSGEGKKILIAVLVLVGLVALIIGGIRLYGFYTQTDKPLTVDDLHLMNFQGKLSEEEGFLYNGFSFVAVDDMWWTEFRRGNTLVKVPMRYNPKQVENITITGKLSREFDKEKELYLTINPEIEDDRYYTLAVSDLSFKVAQAMNRYPVSACTKEAQACGEREILSCDAPKDKAVIELVKSSETKVELLGSCVRIYGEGFELSRAKDAFLYKAFGVIS